MRITIGTPSPPISGTRGIIDRVRRCSGLASGPNRMAVSVGNGYII